MFSSIVSSKGQITIPAEVRRALGLSAGDEVMFFDEGGGQFVLRPRTGSIRDLEGIVPKLDYVPTLEELDEGIAAAIEEEYRRGVAADSTDTSKGEAA